MDDPNADMEARAKSDARLGVGAFHQGGDKPPLLGTGFPKGYLDPTHLRKPMKKFMSKGSGSNKACCKMKRK